MEELAFKPLTQEVYSPYVKEREFYPTKSEWGSEKEQVVESVSSGSPFNPNFTKQVFYCTGVFCQAVASAANAGLTFALNGWNGANRTLVQFNFNSANEHDSVFISFSSPLKLRNGQFAIGASNIFAHMGIVFGYYEPFLEQ